jgi:hypothetical protein
VPWPRRLLTCSTGWLTGTRELSKKKQDRKTDRKKKSVKTRRNKKRFVTKIDQFLKSRSGERSSAENFTSYQITTTLTTKKVLFIFDTFLHEVMVLQVHCLQVPPITTELLLLPPPKNQSKKPKSSLQKPIMSFKQSTKTHNKSITSILASENLS